MLTKSERTLIFGAVATMTLFMDGEHVARGWTSTLTKEDREHLLRLSCSGIDLHMLPNLVRLLRAAEAER